ncbi:MAG: Crp/Fnr family transcriptional regulator [Rhodospirillales bacterium]|nr:Crp/Fnr family transcriptional regulator [Rhodospirillales bacterium]MDG4602879.1 Crp/Fnr family transcriptional regulator [Defluviicoccus sp.]MDG4609627.1 Crp/Fnr family transcriptional regulator [Defluviicoccus sp.]HRW60232.1 Crp/Fnr family transcriptional regulator [Defluviicoccus sp.]
MIPAVRDLLGQHFLLKHLAAAELDQLARMAITRLCRPNEAVFLKGDPGNSMMAVVHGRVRICSYSSEGREVILNVINPGEVFGEIALIDGGSRTADAFAMDATELVVLSRRDFLPFLERNPQVCIKLLEVLCERLRATSAQVEDFFFLDLRSRLAKRLLAAADHAANNGAGGDPGTVRLSQHMLASMIGTSREAVNKQLRAWEEAGLIALKRGAVKIINRQRLEEIVAEEAP